VSVELEQEDAVGAASGAICPAMGRLRHPHAIGRNPPTCGGFGHSRWCLQKNQQRRSGCTVLKCSPPEDYTRTSATNEEAPVDFPAERSRRPLEVPKPEKKAKTIGTPTPTKVKKKAEKKVELGATADAAAPKEGAQGEEAQGEDFIKDEDAGKKATPVKTSKRAKTNEASFGTDWEKEWEKECASMKAVAGQTGVRGQSVVRDQVGIRRAKQMPDDDVEAAEEGVTLVRTKQQAARALKILMKLRGPGHIHAIDTETIDWHPKISPVGNGRIVCFQIYCGPDVDFGNGPRLFIDNLDVDSRGPSGLLETFQDYLEDKDILKVFHNYSFDFAMFRNHGIRVDGFAADTMHMARLEDSAQASYSLASMSQMKCPRYAKLNKFKDVVSKTKDIRDVLLDIERREAGIAYACLDSAATWHLYQVLRNELEVHRWENPFAPDERGLSMFDFYQKFWVPLGQTLVDMEARGIYVDTEHLKKQELLALEDFETAIATFLNWLRNWYRKEFPGDEDLVKNVDNMKTGSPVQMKALLFGKKGHKVTVAQIRIRCIGLPLVLAQTLMKDQNPSMSLDLFRELGGKDPRTEKGCGPALEYIGKEGCQALSAIGRAKFIEKARSSFLKPLQNNVDKDSRVHSSFNLNTSTGRLSSRCPNLQQQPALDKDKYAIRSAFRAVPGKKLIVADYAQLELRVLAHDTNCESMVTMLSSDCDIHSRTAVDMYDHVKAAVESGEVLLEGGDGSIPTVKEKFGTERRNAKSLNFGLMYGLGPQGLSKQLDIDVHEAEETIERWYRSRPEVRQWQQRIVKEAVQQKVPKVKTLRGRSRRLDCLRSKNRALQSGAMRQAINAPAQGGGADIVNEAMISIGRCAELQRLGYELILQVHDELILEGPEEHAEAALKLVRKVMESPFLDGVKLRVPLPVDVHIVQSWNQAK